jgi:hypothetical protein
MEHCNLARYVYVHLDRYISKILHVQFNLPPRGSVPKNKLATANSKVRSRGAVGKKCVAPKLISLLVHPFHANLFCSIQF